MVPSTLPPFALLGRQVLAELFFEIHLVDFSASVVETLYLASPLICSFSTLSY